MKTLNVTALRDALRRSFGFLPAVGIVAGLVLGFVLPVVDGALRVDFGIFSFTERDSARSLLETIASVAGVGFSVTIVAFTLASQQLSPRVLRTFQSDRLSQGLLGAFLGTFASAWWSSRRWTPAGRRCPISRSRWPSSPRSPRSGCSSPSSRTR
jgi:uncharacterized membrane protein